LHHLDYFAALIAGRGCQTRTCFLNPRPRSLF
jgi:hypothetical protein